MPLKVWNGSSWQVQAQINVWNGSAWIPITAGKVWNGSAWVQFHPGVQLQDYPASSGTIALSNDAFALSPCTSSVTIELNSNGTATYSYFGTDTGTGTFATYSWLLTGANTDYYAYMDAPSGDAFSTGTTGSSLQLNTTRSWTLTVTRSSTGTSSKTNTSTLRIKNSAGTDIVSLPTQFYVEATVL